ncbi:predicted GPI-anchored protein 58 [Mesocricetus auratus]|uniref:Predicted GPI-anchored protein 58 n=1 Tax=Mesocricetus auratus TaxID=10036 RepID=A0A1U8C5D7_MESAU|nr:predicted GPI-anchored protein 58 [Mesocricetus auratus]
MPGRHGGTTGQAVKHLQSLKTAYQLLYQQFGPPHVQNSNENATPQTTLSPGSTPQATATPTCQLSRLRSRSPLPGPLPSAAVRKGREKPAKPAPPSARPRPIAAGRASVAASSPSVTSRNLATPQPSLRSRRRARSQHKMAASAAGEERASRAPSSARGEPSLEHRARRPQGSPQRPRARPSPGVEAE